MNNSKFINDFDQFNPEVIRTQPSSRSRSCNLHTPVDIKYFDEKDGLFSDIEEVKPRYQSMCLSINLSINIDLTNVYLSIYLSIYLDSL
jgi:hypothetical protein